MCDEGGGRNDGKEGIYGGHGAIVDDSPCASGKQLLFWGPKNDSQ